MAIKRTRRSDPSKPKRHRSDRRRPGPPATRGSDRSKPAAVLFPALATSGRGVVGLGVATVVAEAFGDGVETRASVAHAFVRGPRAARLPNATMERMGKRICRADFPAVARTLAALGSIHRLTILSQLLEGPATYRALEHRTRLKAGPLYHHVNQLRLANLIGPKSRDTYVLTRAGRNAVLAAVALGSLIKDATLRPAPGEKRGRPRRVGMA